MPSLRDVKRRITSIRNTTKVTHALEAVSATKMRRWQERALNARPFAVKALTLLSFLQEKLPKSRQHPIFKKPKNASAPVAFVLVSADKGLCGGYNIKLLTHSLEISSKEAREVKFIALGKYGRDYLARRNRPVLFDEIGFGEQITKERIQDIYTFLEEGFLRGTFSKVLIGYTEFITTLRQEPRVRQLLPLKQEDLEAIVEGILPQSGRYAQSKQDASSFKLHDFEYVFEPSVEAIVPSLVRELTQTALLHMLYEANASEHSARMIAMKNATDNASEILSDLQLQYNKARQGEITKGVLEVAGGAAALQS